jgi:hypothetical protein
LEGVESLHSFRVLGQVVFGQVGPWRPSKGGVFGKKEGMGKKTKTPR